MHVLGMSCSYQRLCTVHDSWRRYLSVLHSVKTRGPSTLASLPERAIHVMSDWLLAAEHPKRGSVDITPFLPWSTVGNHTRSPGFVFPYACIVTKAKASCRDTCFGREILFVGDHVGLSTLIRLPHDLEILAAVSAIGHRP